MDDYAIHGYDASRLPNGRKIAWVLRIEQTKDKDGWSIHRVTTGTINREHYILLTSKAVCKTWRWLGSTQKVSSKMTMYGYVPYEVISVSPSKDKRIIYNFYFGDEGLTYMYHRAKWNAERAKQRMLNAKSTQRVKA